ncbi:MAG: hypothetical protein QOF64_2507 [Candidatus Binatota bacterium]|nr:hypothetical protein [Candidatus Binatota bacterium]
MRTREKIMVLLVAITAILGSILYINFRNNEVEANYLRWLFINNLKHGTFSPLQFIAEELPAGSLLYGGLALFALVVLTVVLKMLRDGELQALRMRLTDVGAAKNQAESLLQEEVWKGKNERQAKDAASRDLEASIDRIEHLIADLNEKEKLVKVRETELVALKSRAVEQSESGLFDSPSDRSRRAELEKTKTGLEAKEELIDELENRLRAKTKLWESQLREKESLVKARDGELAGLRKEITGLGDRLGEMETARSRAERLLQDELREKKKVLEANELASRNDGKRLSEKIGILEHQLSDKDKLLRSREAEILTIRRQLGELGSTKEELESRLHEELGNADNDRRAMEAFVKDAELKYAGTIHTLQDEIAEKDLLLQSRDDEMRGFKMEVRAAHSRLNEVTAAKEGAEVALQQELHQEQQRRRENEIAHKNLQDRFTKDFESLRGRISEKDQTLKSRDGEIKLLAAQIATLNEQLHKAESAKDRAAVSLQDQLRKEQEIRHASDSVIRTLEDGFMAKISAIEKQVDEKQEAAANPDTVELNELRAELKAVNQRMSEMVAAKDNVESLFRDALREKTELLQSTEIGRKDLEEDFADKLRILENQLRVKTDVMQNQASDLLAAKKQLADLSTEKDQGIRSLQATVQQQAELLQSKETARDALESRSSEAIRSLEGQLNERDEMLASGDAEVKASGAKVGKLTAQLAELGSAKDQDARLLREEIRQKTELLHVKESAIKKIEERLSGQIRALESQLGEKANLLVSRDSEIDTFLAKVSALTQERAELASERDKSERLVQEELREKNVLLQAKESSIGEIEGQLTAKVESLEHQLAQKQKLLESSGAELGELRSQIYVLTERMGEVEGAKHRVEAQLHEERNRMEKARAESELNHPVTRRELTGEAQALDDLMKERDQLLKARDKLIQELMVELKEKKSQLAKHEIEVWQGIERRDVWKHRLSKFGIRLKN